MSDIKVTISKLFDRLLYDANPQIRRRIFTGERQGFFIAAPMFIIRAFSELSRFEELPPHQVFSYCGIPVVPCPEVSLTLFHADHLLPDTRLIHKIGLLPPFVSENGSIEALVYDLTGELGTIPETIAILN